MKKYYVKKPVVIEAIEVIDTKEGREQAIKFCSPHIFSILGKEDDKVVGSIETLEGTMIVREGDFIIRGIKGECYPCRADIFLETHDELTDRSKLVMKDDISRIDN